MFDIVVVGGGHAGIEAAHIASQFSHLKIAIISMPGIGLASAPCNPSIGGVGKGQIVRELDALGGIMPILADLSGIQYRTLNESKGYAVQSTRVQIDKDLYSANAEELISKISNIEIIREKVTSLSKLDDGFSITTECSTWNTKKIIMTVGTFLNGKMHTGSDQTIGGRDGCQATDSLTTFFENIKTVPQRFKTGTPARINKKSIDYEKLEIQPSDLSVNTFHVLHGTNDRFLKQVDCYLTYTNAETLKIIRDNREKSPMFNGQIKAIGARYCPSIEDKAYRYQEKDIHHVFIEPEGLDSSTVYPSGISTSLPKNIQDKFVKTIVGLENAKIEKYGYAVEYDVLDTTELYKSLEHKNIRGLYFAGQVNGTSGYEEAAGQGYVAGVNAALAIINNEEIHFSREDSYIGVMIEDLVSNTRDEPYRLFTARSENRLMLREDNSIIRMKHYRQKLGLSLEMDLYIKSYTEQYNLYLDILSNTYISEADEFIIQHSYKVPRRTSMFEFIKQSQLDPIQTLTKYFQFCGIDISTRLIQNLAITSKYAGYILRANDQNKKQDKLKSMKLNWQELCQSENISFECKQRIKKIKPTTFGQLKIIEGIRPATLSVVASQSL